MARTESLFDTFYFDYLTPRQRVVVFNLAAKVYNGYYDLKPNAENLPRFAPGVVVLLLAMAIPSDTNPNASLSLDSPEAKPITKPPHFVPESALTPTLVATRTSTPTPTDTSTPTQTSVKTSTPTLRLSPTFTPTSTQTPTPTEIPTPLKTPDQLKPSFEAFFEQTVKIGQDQNFWQVLHQLLAQSSILQQPWVNKENNVSQIDVLVDWVIIFAQKKEIDLNLLLPGDEIKLKMLVTDGQIQQLKRVAQTKSLMEYLNLLASKTQG